MKLISIFKAAFKTTAVSGIIVFSLLCCNSIPDATNSNRKKSKSKKYFEIQEPATDAMLSFNDSLKIKFNAIGDGVSPDSTQIFIEGEKILTQTGPTDTFALTGVFRKVGRQNLRIRVFFNDSLTQTLTTRITVLSEHEPEELDFIVLRKFDHNPNSSTQGYIYRDNYIYEGTGREGYSRIHKINPANGEILRELKMDDDIFGEGITELNGKLYQLSYQHKLGFVYDFKTFSKIQEFELQTFEGWGLTNDDENLIISEGSSMLYFYDPIDFTQVNQLDVCDHKGLIPSLNELEYVDGSIWANIYTREYIVKIDAKTGSMLARLDLSDLFPEGLPRDYAHVLNGIAYNPDNDSFFITGKLWPVVYEIRILE